MPYQYLSIIAFIALGAVVVLVSSMRRKAMLANLKGPEQLSALLGAAFATSRQPGEDEPVCVLAFQGPSPLIVGATNQRVLVVKQDGVLRSEAYDAAGEQLPVGEKNNQRRGYFRWTHDKAVGYVPQVVQGPFAGEDWVMPLQVSGFSGQQSALREFARRFNFAWFY